MKITYKKQIFVIIWTLLSIFIFLKNSNFTKKVIDEHILEKNIILSDENVTYQFENKKEEFKVATDIQDIISRGELVVCSIKDEISDLFRSKDQSGNFIGKDIDFAKKMAQVLGVKLRFKMFYETYDDVVNAIQRGEGDIGISHLSYTKNRSLKVLFSDPYIISQPLLLVNRMKLYKFSGGSIRDSLNREDLTLAIPSGTNYVDLAKTLFNNAYIEYYDNSRINEIISNYKFDALIFDDITIKNVLRTNRKLAIRLLPILLKDLTDNLYVIVNFKSLSFIYWINEFIREIEKPENADDMLEAANIG